MTAAVAIPLPVPSTSSAADALFAAEARKRRREILASSRVEATLNKRAKTNAKKPQRKYDPDVPMTKEEAAIWRREQRRKRNRESAAASRQRQRDRITELEEQVNGFKNKYEDMLNHIRTLETTTPPPSMSITPLEVTSSIAVSPTLSPSTAEEKVFLSSKMISRPSAQSRIIHPILDP
jgi:hypothetical protein